MAESSTVRTKQDAIITISDGTTTYTVSKEAGDFQTSTPRFNVTSVLDRGLFTNAPTRLDPGGRSERDHHLRYVLPVYPQPDLRRT
ncbi:MAG: hypothetical protein EBZ93_13190 [Actinobacteria bacterium]|nr:hypothetical protein [Actinomycetota bacterium]